MAEAKKGNITYCTTFWLFLIGSVAGVIIEGMFCLLYKGRWENHVVSLFAQYNILYGIGAVLFFIGAAKLRIASPVQKAVAMAIVATLLELFCGLLLKHVLGMRAWNYANSFMNYQGLICPAFSLAWGIAALGFCKLYPRVNRMLTRFKQKHWRIACASLSVLIAADLCLTGAAILRWSDRHHGFPADTAFQHFLDEELPDEWMQERFIEWEFLDTQEVTRNEQHSH